ncbi:MAG: N-acetylmuramoyl-L-alanine amidase [Eubacterium sp.]|nr:N-acetylmuramoyl-L-alanine amidase [Eubacterium sp.]
MRFKRLGAVALVMALALSMTPVKLSSADTVETKKLICIDPGHQAHANTSQEPIGPGASETKYKVTGGTSGCVTHVPEYKLVLRVGKKLKKELKERGYDVIMTRTTNDVDISNSERAAIANEAGADVFIRIHADSSESSSAVGAMTIAPASNNPFMSKKNRKKSGKLSRKVISAFCAATGAKSRGVWYTNTMSGINWAQVPVTIIEMGFMSNPTEDRLMETADYQEKMVKGMADGIDDFLS